MTREELEAIRNHMSNLPTVGAMYAPVLVEWVAVLLRQRDEVTAQRDDLLDASKEGAWMARALDAERERDEALQKERERCARICDSEFAANWHASAMAAANAAKRCAELIREQEKP